MSCWRWCWCRSVSQTLKQYHTFNSTVEVPGTPAKITTTVDTNVWGSGHRRLRREDHARTEYLGTSSTPHHGLSLEDIPSRVFLYINSVDGLENLLSVLLAIVTGCWKVYRLSRSFWNAELTRPTQSTFIFWVAMPIEKSFKNTIEIVSQAVMENSHRWNVIGALTLSSLYIWNLRNETNYITYRLSFWFNLCRIVFFLRLPQSNALKKLSLDNILHIFRNRKPIVPQLKGYRS